MCKALFAALLGCCLATPSIAQTRSELMEKSIWQIEQQVYLAEAAGLPDLVSFEPEVKAIPRKDKAQADLIGTVAAVGNLSTLSNGRFFRVVILDTNTFTRQLIGFSCLDSLAVSGCGNLRVGQRISTSSDISTFQTGEHTALSLFFLKKLQTR